MDDTAIKKMLDWTPEAYLEALRWWNGLTKEQQDAKEQAFYNTLSPNVEVVSWKSEEWKIYQLYWLGKV